MSYEPPSTRPAHAQDGDIQQYGSAQQYSSAQQYGYGDQRFSRSQRPAYAPYSEPADPPSMSGLAVASLVLGIVALLTSLIPFVNNVSFILALLGVVLAAVGMRGIKKGAHRGNGMAVAGLVLNIVALVAVLAMQSMCSAMLDSASESLSSSSSIYSAGSASAGSSGSSSGSSAGSSSSGFSATTASSQQGGSADSSDLDVPTEYRSALVKAQSYSSIMHMSKQAIYNQLTSEYGEKFAPEAAQYAIDNLDADYAANALAKARSYQQTMNMSPEAIRDQLVSEYGEKFTPEEADYAVSNL